MHLIIYQEHKTGDKDFQQNQKERQRWRLYILNLPDLKGWGVGKLNTDLPQGNQDTGYTSWTGDKVDDVMKNFQVSLPAVNQVCYYRVGLLFPSEWTTHFTRLNSNKSNKAHSSISSIQFTVFCTTYMCICISFFSSSLIYEKQLL